MTELPNKPTYRISEVAEYFNITPRTVYRWIADKKLCAILTRRGQRITKESLDKYMLNNQ